MGYDLGDIPDGAVAVRDVEKSILGITMVKTPFEIPRLFFTLKGNAKSEGVLTELKQKLPPSVRCTVFESAEDTKAIFEGGLAPSSAVVLRDGDGESRNFQMHYAGRAADSKFFPSWAQGVRWGVAVKTKHRFQNCARQLTADFGRLFTDRLANGQFPWGSPKKNEAAPAHVIMPEYTGEILARLNSGPDFAAAIAHTEHALELPKGSRISWCRVASDPIIVDGVYLTRVVQALRKFEVACGVMARMAMAGRDDIRSRIFAGVDLHDRHELEELYLDPPSPCFSVTRPDLHYTGEGLFASEIDEMPGGLPDLIHIDHSYGLNAEKWEAFFQWLTSEGPVLFVVSSEWSKCYISETEWLAAFMRSRGYPAFVLTTDRISEASLTHGGVFYENMRIGTIWRQFPIFETQGKLTMFVHAAKCGLVRMVPEFGHFGNKVWFSMYRRYRDEFAALLDTATREILDAVLPDSHLVESDKSFPCTVTGVSIGNMVELDMLPAESRDRLVLKVTGANAKSARSYGVLMGHGLTAAVWSDWIRERLVMHQPFIIQRRLETGVAKVAVHNTKFNAAELFHCRILLRPWVVNGEIVSVHACAVPSNTLRVHGMVDMAILPVKLGEVT